MAISIHELKALIQSRRAIICIETAEEERATKLIQRAAADLRLVFNEWSSAEGLKGNLALHPSDKIIKPNKLLDHMGSYEHEAVYVLKDFAASLQEPGLARQFRELGQKFQGQLTTMFLIGPRIELPQELKHKATFIELALPNKEELAELLKSVHKSLSRQGNIAVTLQNEDFNNLLDAARGLTLNQARQVFAFIMLEDNQLSRSDIDRVIQKKGKILGEGSLLEFYPAEDNNYDLGGFSNFKRWLSQRQVGFSERARQLNLPSPKGVLIAGVPGCGKSLAAKMSAKNWKVPLLKLDSGRLYDKYIGESEKNFRAATQLAEAMAPCVLWIDEIEKAMSPSQGNDGGLSQRLFGAFLTWLQEKTAPVFVVATANDVMGLPPELLRKGRFDEVFFVDLPQADEREEIFRIHIALRGLDPNAFDLAQLASLSEGFSGAEIEQATIGACYNSIQQEAEPGMNYFEEELRLTRPLSQSRKEDIDNLRSFCKDRFVSVHYVEPG